MIPEARRLMVATTLLLVAFITALLTADIEPLQANLTDATEQMLWPKPRVRLVEKDSGAPARPAVESKSLHPQNGARGNAGDDAPKCAGLWVLEIIHRRTPEVTWPKLSVDPRGTVPSVSLGASRRRDFAVFRESSCTLVGARASHLRTGPNGFDVERESDAIVQAVSVRFEQLANPNCKRQRSFRPSPRGLIGAEPVRLSSSDSASTPTRDRSRHPASAILNSAGGGGPIAPGYGEAVGCRKADYARERTSEATFTDPSSILGGSTLKTRKNGAQQQGSAVRPAPGDNHASGSTASARVAAVQPGSIGDAT